MSDMNTGYVICQTIVKVDIRKYTFDIYCLCQFIVNFDIFEMFDDTKMK